MKILVLGHKNHGKTTLASLLSRFYQLRYADSSAFVCEKAVFPTLSQRYGYATPQECHADRDNHRQEWHDLIHEYNAGDPARLTRELLAENDIYCGLRNDVEFEATWHLYDYILWVDASATKPLEPATSMKISYDPLRMMKIDANGTIHELADQLYELRQSDV